MEPEAVPIRELEAPRETAWSRQFIRVGEHDIELPGGVTVADWALERVRSQNPRLRAYLGCIRLLEQALESNYAILHCSPGRLLKIWRQVRRVCRFLKSRLAPTLDEPSVIPRLDRARRNARHSFRVLAATVLRDIERYPYRIPSPELPLVRKLLCTSIGEIHAFLRDTFGEIVAADPRSLHDSDYFLSKRFPQDIEEAEWLYATVDKLNDYLHSLGTVWTRQLEELIERMQSERVLPPPSVWVEVETFLNILTSGLTARLREALALRGIRFDEMEALDGYAYAIPHHCQALIEVHAMAREAIGEIQRASADAPAARAQRLDDLVTCHAVFAQRVSELMLRIDGSLRDLTAYVPIWLDAIESRRALLLTKNPEPPESEPPAA